MEAAQQMLMHPNAQVQAVGAKLLESSQKLMEYKQQQQYLKDQIEPSAAPISSAAPAAMPAAAPLEMFATKDSSGKLRYVINGSEVTPEEYQSAQSGVVAQAVPTNKLRPSELPITEPTNALAPAPVNAFVAKTAENLKTEIMKGDAKYGKAQGWQAQRELLVDQLKEAIKTPVYHNVVGVGLVDPKTARIVVPESSKPTELQRNYEYAKGQGFKGDIFAYEKSLKEAGRAPPQPRAEQPPVAVVDPATGKQIYVTREQAISGKMTPAAAMESLSPKEIQKREAAYPQATFAVQGFESKSDKFVEDLTKLRNHPGLSSITGIIAGRAPGLTADGRAAEALYDKIVAKGGFQALQDLRDASKTGGALGNISNQEGKQLVSSFAAIDRRQNAEDVRAAIDQAISDVQGTKTRMREAYDATYSYKNSAPSISNAAPQGTGGFKYLGKE